MPVFIRESPLEQTAAVSLPDVRQLAYDLSLKVERRLRKEPVERLFSYFMPGDAACPYKGQQNFWLLAKIISHLAGPHGFEIDEERYQLIEVVLIRTRLFQCVEDNVTCFLPPEPDHQL